MIKYVSFFFCLIFGLAALTVVGFAVPEESLLIPLLSKAPKIDGILDNSEWEEEALKFEQFFQLAPIEGGPPSEKTVMYMGYDRKNLYVAIKCYDSEPDKIRASITNRDQCMEDDWVFVFLDTFNEKRRALSFLSNPLGVQMDCIRIEEGGNDNMDFSWDAAFSSSGRIDEDGYTVELAIPFKSLRFPDDEEKRWSLVLGRSIARSGEIVMWPTFTRDIPGLLAQGGEIVLTEAVEKGKNFELMPVATSLKTKGKKLNFDPGINFKWGITSNATLDFTVNPDFSHIEADAPQIDVNQRFALFYEEKRPFFLEGMEIFRFPQINMVYTRRINNPIVGGKLTGKIGRFTYGVLSALDTSPTESLWDVNNGGGANTGNALFNIFRIKADVLKESYIGFAFTDRQINGSYNRVAGIDGQLKFNNKFFFNFQALASKTKLKEDTETDIVPALYGEFFYYSKHWGAGIFSQAMHPDFEASSGYVNRVDYKSYGAFTFVTIYPEKNYLNQIQFNLNTGRRFFFSENILQDEWLRGDVNFRFTEFSQLRLRFQTDMERYSGVDFHKSSFELEGEFMFLKWLTSVIVFETGGSIYYDPDDPFLGHNNTYALILGLKPSKRLRLDLQFIKQTFFEERGGDILYDYNVLRTRTTYQLSKTLSVRGIVDYNHFDKQIYGSFLFSWILRPGTVFFLGV
ncbi:MAG: carbohydrate binding family 9 domain-containing protein, partial [Candidatus Aminicenantes bacterium]|nr:carbohydrate binding family 9 domain-containing protein [Candidatus Aminicenantes bacterium]